MRNQNRCPKHRCEVTLGAREDAFIVALARGARACCQPPRWATTKQRLSVAPGASMHRPACSSPALASRSLKQLAASPRRPGLGRLRRVPWPLAPARRRRSAATHVRRASSLQIHLGQGPILCEPGVCWEAGPRPLPMSSSMPAVQRCRFRLATEWATSARAAFGWRVSGRPTAPASQATSTALQVQNAAGRACNGSAG